MDRENPMRLLATLALCAAAAVPTFAAADMADSAIKARRGYMQLIGYNFGPLAAMAKGDLEYDAAAAEAYAANLSALSFYDIPNLFPEGSSNADKPGDTRALPALWSDMDGVGRQIVTFKAAIAAISEQAGQGRAALGPAVAELGKTCGACHDDYRARDF
jgi:cytochrome c556